MNLVSVYQIQFRGYRTRALRTLFHKINNDLLSLNHNSFCEIMSQVLLPCTPLTEFHLFNDRYAAINRQNDSQLLTKTFFVVFAINSTEKRPAFLAKTFFWSSPLIRPKIALNVWRRSFCLVAAC